MTASVSSIKCVYFSHGQRLSPEHLNALNDFSLRRSAFVTKALTRTAGILDGLRLRVLPEEPLCVVLSAGCGMNSEGSLIVQQEELFLRLSEMIGHEEQTYILQLLPVESLEEPYQDEGNEEFPAFKYRSFGAKFVLSAQLHPLGIELARVKMSSHLHSLRMARLEDPIEADSGVIDDRHAARVKIYNSRSIPFAEQAQMQTALTELRASLREFQFRYESLTRVQVCLELIDALELEVVEEAVSISRSEILVKRLKAALFDFIEELRQLHHQVNLISGELWESFFSHLSRLGSIRSKEALILSFREIHSFNIHLREKVLQLQTDEEKKVLINQSLSDLRAISFQFGRQHAFGGTLFDLSSERRSQGLLEVIESDAEYKTFKTVKSSYEQASPHSDRGIFFSQGKIFIRQSQLDPNRDTILLLKTYKRRGRQDWSIGINGSSLKRFELRPNESVDRFLNQGVLVSKDLLVKGENQILIDLKQVDLDFGLMGLWIYQRHEGGAQ